MTTPISVYISYAREDQDLAGRIYSDLKSAGFKPWMDAKDILPGQNRDHTIRKAIKESRYFLALMSGNSVTERGYVHREMKIALDNFNEFKENSVYIIPVSLDGTRAGDEALESLEYVDLGDYQKGLARILEALGAPGRGPAAISRGQESARRGAASPSDDGGAGQNMGQAAFQGQTELGQYYWDEIFVGREDLVERILNTRKACFIFGARRIGKTSLLRRLENKFQERGVPAFYISIQGMTDSDKVKRKLGNAFRRNEFNVDQALLDAHSFLDFLEELDIAVARPIVVLMDEAEEIESLEKNEPGFMDKLRNIVETSGNIRFILTASPHFLRVASGAACTCSAFLSAFHTDILPVMTRGESSELMQLFVKTITDDDIEHILTYTHYQPYLIRIFMSKLLRDGAPRPPSRDHAMDAYVANALEGVFPNYMEGLDEEDQTLVRGIHGGALQTGARYEARLRALVQYGYLKAEAGEHRISNWFFQFWLDCEFSGKHPDECLPDPPQPPGEKEPMTSPAQNNNNDQPTADYWKTATLFQLIYSLCGLFLGLICVGGGIFLLISDVVGKASWTAKILGAESTVSDAGPGVVLFIVGLFFVLITRFVIKKRR